MELQNIELKDGEPHSVTVKMTIEEAGWTALTANDADATDKISGDIYRCLIQDLFNRFWDDGLDGYINGEASE